MKLIDIPHDLQRKNYALNKICAFLKILENPAEFSKNYEKKTVPSVILSDSTPPPTFPTRPTWNGACTHSKNVQVRISYKFNSI